MLKIFYFVAILASVALLSSLIAISYLSSPPSGHSSEQQGASHPENKEQAQEDHSFTGFIRYLFPDGIAVFTFWLVIATIVLGVGAIIQIGYLERAENIAGTTAKAAKDSADAANKAADANIKALEISRAQMRAYITVPQPSKSQIKVDANHTMTLNIKLLNSGQSAARAVKGQVLVGMRPQDDPAPIIVTQQLVFLNDIDKNEPLNIDISATLVPKETAPRFPPTMTFWDAVNQESAFVYITVILDFVDIFGEPARSQTDLGTILGKNDFGIFQPLNRRMFP
jgi:hypothetical protein